MPRYIWVIEVRYLLSPDQWHPSFNHIFPKRRLARDYVKQLQFWSNDWQYRVIKYVPQETNTPLLPAKGFTF